MTSVIQASIRLTFFLVVLPFCITYFHFRHVAYRSNYIFTGPVHPIHGILQPPSEIKMQMNVDVFHGIWQGHIGPDQQVYFKMMRSSAQHHHEPWYRWGWPSVIRVDALFSDQVFWDPSMAMLQPLLRYNSYDKTWCLSHGDLIVCKDGGDARSPPSGIWGRANLSLRLSHYGPRDDGGRSEPIPTNPSSKGTFRRNPNKKSRQNRNLEQILRRPATTLLLAVNIGLAYLYWNRRTPPADVSKIYNKIVQEHELWRSFTGATAHFEALHLGFNMMALYSLGTELEEGFGSIPFFFYNISLIPITTMIMMGMVYLQIRQRGNTGLAETSTVGYSGVLFAWMVVASLERPQTCPIPFMAKVCFKTHDIMGLKWNLSPIVQLVVAQCIMQRVSFVGHLAGIIAGFFLHWNMLTLELVQPSVLIPLLYLVHLWRVRRIVPVAVTTQKPEMAVSLDQEQAGPRFDARRHKRERELAMQTLLSRTTALLFIMAAISFATMDVSMTVSSILHCILFYYCKQSHGQLIASSANPTENSREILRLGALWRVCILASILKTIVDSMALASWVVTANYWYGAHIIIGFLSATLILLLLLWVQLFSLSLACKSLEGIGQQNGSGAAFSNFFRFTVLENASIIGTCTIPWLTKTASWTAFEGLGIALGTATSSPGLISVAESSQVSPLI